jgi:DNA invertase Pin-like site-specific DNA recombinase
MTTPPPSKTVALRVYIRQSLDKSKQAESEGNQLGECERLLASIGRSDLWASRIEYTDVDRSGDDFSREQLSRLVSETQTGDIVLTTKQDRIGRNMIDVAALMRDLVSDRRAVLYTTETGTRAITMDTAEEAAMVMLRGMGGQAELERIRSRVRAGLHQRAVDGFAAGPVPFGYRNVLIDPTVDERRKSKKRTEIVPEQAALVRRIALDMYVHGEMGVPGIAKQLNAEGISSPRGAGWSKSHLWDMLREPRYAGFWAHGETKVKKRLGSKNGKKRVLRERSPENEVVRSIKPELAIFTNEEWTLIQTMIATRKRDMPNAQRADSLLSGGRLQCYCSRNMSMKSESKGTWRKRYYVCASYRTDGRCDNRHYMNADRLEQEILDALRTTFVNEVQAAVMAVLHEQSQVTAKEACFRAVEAEQLRVDIETLRRERVRLVKLAAAADDVPEVVEALRANQTRSQRLQEALALATRAPMEKELVAKLEARVVARMDALRQGLAGAQAREALQHLFPQGLRLARAPGGTGAATGGDGGGGAGGDDKPVAVQGEASLPHVNDPDGFLPGDRDAKVPFFLVLAA